MLKALSFKSLNWLSATRFAEVIQFRQDQKFRRRRTFSREKLVFHWKKVSYFNFTDITYIYIYIYISLIYIHCIYIYILYHYILYTYLYIYICVYISIHIYIYIYIYVCVCVCVCVYVYSIHHWGILSSSCRELAGVVLEPTTSEFHSEALTDWAVMQWIQLALRANFVQPLEFRLLFSVRFHFSYCLCRQLPRLF